MATECDVNKSRRFDPGMSRRTRRSTSLITCYQDQHAPSLAQQLRRDAKLKTLFQCQDTELQPPYPYEDQELRILEAPLQSKGAEQEAPDRYHDEQEDKPHHYLDDEQEKKPFKDQDGERKTPKQYLDEDQKTLQQCQEEEEKVPNQYKDEENTPEQYQDEEQKTAKQHKEEEEEEEEEEEKTSEKYQDEEHKSLKTLHQCQDKDQKAPGQCKTAKTKLITPPFADDVPRFSLQDLIQEKQLLIGEAKVTTTKLRNGEKPIAYRKLPPPPAAGSTALAMVIKRPDGGQKPMGVIRRCVKALNQMVKAKHGSKKNKPF